MILYLVFSYNVIKKINNTISEKNKLILIGCVTLILLQTFVHVGVNIRLLPTTGMTLPFLSYGGSFMVVCFLMLGMVQSVFRHRNSVL